MGDKYYDTHYHLDNLEEPLTVQLTEKNTGEINQTKNVTLVPGDMVTVASGIETGQLDCTGFASMNAIMHVENISDVKVTFIARGTIGPIGSIQEVDVVHYNRPMNPGQVVIWSYTKPIFSTYFKAYFNITEEAPGGQVDVNHAVVLSKGNIPA